MNWLVVAAGSAIGGVLRYALSRAWPSAPEGWPKATLVVNLTGSFLIGALFVLLAARSGEQRLFWMTGVLGGFTTYSAFALETTLILESGWPLRATMYVLATVVGCLLAALAGRFIAATLWGRS
jgi:fluoride exporter